MGIDRRAVSISLIISACLSAGLAILLSNLGFERPVAEAAGPLATGANEGLGLGAARSPDGRATPEERRIRAIVENLITPSGHVNQRAVRALRAQGPAVVPALLERFNGKEAALQEAILSVLEAFDDPAITDRLIGALEGMPSRRMADRIGLILRPQGDERFCDRLIRLAQSPQSHVRLACARALGACTHRSTSVALVRMLKEDEDENVRVNALSALRESKEGFLEQALRFALSDASAVVRLEGVRTVEESGLATFRNEVETLAQDDPTPQVRRAAGQALDTLDAGGAEGSTAEDPAAPGPDGT